MPGKNDPLTHEEMSSAATKFLELYKIVADQMPKASVEDCLKIMESVAKLAHKDRADKLKKEADERFGFVKVTTDETDDTDS
jgi:hypothetical protein